MFRPSWIRWTPFLALAFVAAGAMPVVAQAPAVPDAIFQSYQNSRGHCVDVGLALAVMSQSGTVAEALAAAPDAPSLTAAGGNARHIVVDAPAMVGACADFEGVWGDGASGVALASLTLMPATNSSALAAAPLAEDEVNERAMGPRRLEQTMRAIAKLEKPGKYAVVAVIEVSASQGASTGASPAGKTVTDRARVPFMIEVRQSGRQPAPDPKPDPVAHGAIGGLVLDEAGHPIEGARIVASPTRRLAGSGAAPGAATTGRALSDAEGKYAIKLPVGSYHVSAAADGFTTQYYDRSPEIGKAKPVRVEAGEETHHIDFSFAPRVLTAVAGRVVDADGNGIARALVLAVPKVVNPNLPQVPARPSTWTDENGDYQLELSADTWLIGASRGSTNAIGGGPMLWWDGQTSMDDADPVELADGELREGINFALPH